MKSNSDFFKLNCNIPQLCVTLINDKMKTKYVGFLQLISENRIKL